MGTVSRVHTFSAGSVLTAAQLNNEFDNLLTSSAINGGLDATNLGVTAGQVTASKALVVDSSRNLDDTTTTNMINNLTLSGTLKLIDDQALTLGTNDDITVKYDETTNDALEIAAAVEGAALAVVLKADQGDDAGDEWKLGVADGGTLTLGNDIASAGTYVTGLTITPNSTTAAWLLDFEGDVVQRGSDDRHQRQQQPDAVGRHRRCGGDRQQPGTGQQRRQRHRRQRHRLVGPVSRQRRCSQL